MIDSILLDLDGTLWDSTAVVADAWNKALEQYPQVAFRATADNLKALFGKPLDEIVEIAVPELNAQEREELSEKLFHYEDEALEETPGTLFEGVAETIQKLSKKYKVCIVSNCQNGYIEQFLRQTGLGPYITDFECPGRTGLVKGPNNKLVMERNHFQSPIYVGDTQGDKDAAAFAGIPFVFASYGFGKPDSWDYKISSFPELLELVEG